MSTLPEKITRWMKLSTNSIDYNDILKYIEFRSHRSFNEFHPTIGPHKRFIQRLEMWLNNLQNDNEQQIFLQFIEEIFFIGSSEFGSLYRAAQNEHIIPWIIESAQINFESDYNTRVQEELEKTLFCAATDSFHVSDFHHVNNISGKSLRPEWRSLTELGDINRIRSYCNKLGIKYIVILEDFVGTGNQLINKDNTGTCIDGTVGFVSDLGPDIHVLICPLIICPEGANNIIQILKKYQNITFSPVIILSNDLFISPNDVKQFSSNTVYKSIFDISNRISTTIPFRYGPFGY